MSQPVPFRAPEAPAPMDPENHQSPDEVSAPGEPPVSAHTKPSRLSKLPDNPLQAILGAAIVLLLGFALTQTNDRISRLEDKVDAGFIRIDERFTAQDAKFDERFTAQDAQFGEIDRKFDEIDQRFDEIDLKLTALIAALNATEEVDAALEGRLLNPSAPSSNEPAN